jgi:hypothetical protein
MIHRKFGTLLQIAFSAALLLGPLPAQAEDEPIAYIAHGAFFDSMGNQIAVSPEFVAKAQEFYRNKLVSSLNDAKKREFSSFESRLKEGVKFEGQAQLVLQQRLLDWLIENSTAKPDARMIGKLNALKYKLNWKLSTKTDLQPTDVREEFRIEPQLDEKLKLPLKTGATVRTFTMNRGQAYINECVAAGVPIPPPIGQLDPAGTNGWKSQGFIPANKQFIVGTPAEVRTFHSTSPEGMCFALPRYTDATMSVVELDGVICMGKSSSKVCIWDNQMNGSGFSFVSGTKIPIGVPDLTINPSGQYQGGGFELDGGTGGVCTDCHAGQNPYIIHPQVDLGGGVLMGSLGQSPQNLPTFAVTRYDPLVAADWPQNQLSMTPKYVPNVCSGCHVSGGIGGAFPHLSTALGQYCNTILAQAIMKTMPPFNPGGEANNPDVITFKNWCGTSASSGPSDRGDPHVLTTTGIKYDFQAAGEFTALRDSSTGFELQTRQSPISTTFVPGADSYTGLQTCVSINTAAAFRLGKHRVTFQPGTGKGRSDERLELRVDGTQVDLLANGINFGGGTRIAKAAAGGGIDVQASDGTHIIISPTFWASEGYWYLDIEVLNTPAREGIMGTILPSNWLPLAPDGQSFGPMPALLTDRYSVLYGKFADGWRVTNKTSMFDYGSGLSTADFTDRNWPQEKAKNCTVAGSPKPPSQKVSPETAQRLCRAIKDKTAFDECVFDMTAMNDTGVVQSYLRSLKLRQDAITAGP